MHLARGRSKNANVTTGVNDSADDIVLFQRLHGAIDCKTLGDAPKIDAHASAKSNGAILFQHDVAPVPTARVHGGYIEDAAAFLRKTLGSFQNAPSPRMDKNISPKRITIGSPDVAHQIVKAHKAMHVFNCREGAIDRTVQVRLVSALGGDVNERAEKRPRSPHFI